MKQPVKGFSAVMPTANRPANEGSSLNDDASRVDGPQKVTGRAKYGRDMYFKDGLFAAFIRCPYGAADLESADESAAASSPGVVEVQVSGRDGKYHGQTMGYIVAQSPLALRRGLRALNPKWKRKPCKTRIEDEVDAAARIELDPDVEESLAQCDHVLEATYTVPVHIHVCLETHGASVDWRDDGATVYSSTQGTFAARDGMADALGLPDSKFEVVCEFIGGGFGSKLNGAGKEGSTAGRIAAKHKRPVWLFVNRAEDQTDTGNRPSLRASVKVGFKNDGTIVAGKLLTWGGIGVNSRGGGVALPNGRYRYELDKTHKDVSFNAGGPRPFRAPPHPTGVFVEELMLDEIATIAGIDPLDLKIRLDGDADRKDMMRLAADLIGWKDRPKTGSQTGPVRRGFGIAGGTWHSANPGDSAEVVINRDGSVESRTGTQDIGTGQRTSMAVCTAAKLGIPLDLVTVRIGRSTLPKGPGSGGSVTTPNSAPAMMDAALAAKDKLLTMLAAQAGADVSEFDIVDGQVVRDGKKYLAWADACAKIGDAIVGRPAGQAKSGRGPRHSHGVQAAEVEVDAETGIVRVKKVIAFQSCGQAIVRKTAECQIIGGVIQGVSNALFEERVLDRNVGAMLNANMESYKVAGPADMPHIVPILWTRNQRGIAGIGEPPIIPTMGAVACAVFNAVGRPVRDLPLTPDKVLAALEGGAA